MTHGRETASSGRLLGVYRFDELSVVVTSKEMLLVPVEDGVPIERTEFAFTANRFGLSDNLDLLIDTPGGVQVSTDLGANWRAEIPLSVQWLSVSSRPPSVDEARRYATGQLSWERWLQDLHSGRFFGVIGVWLMSFAGAAFMLLSVTGLYMWYSTRRRAS